MISKMLPPVFVYIALCLFSNIYGQRINCADTLDQIYDCLENLRNTTEAQTLSKKRDSIFEKCVTDAPPHCSTMKKAVDNCQDQTRKDPFVLWTRYEVKQDVNRCFERFNRTSSYGSTSNFGDEQTAPPPPPPPSARDPCAPTEAQKQCLRTEVRNDRQAFEIATKLKSKQKDCYARASTDCRPDDKPQLRECIEKAKQPLIQRAVLKMQECMQAVMGQPQFIQNSKIQTAGFGNYLSANQKG